MRRGEMMQVISNLIANSMHAMRSGGTLSISVEDADGEDNGVAMTIEDTGSNIASQHIPRVFEAFYTTRSETGTGIGLFVAKKFVEGHGGSIDLESRKDREKTGTTVRIFLPSQTSYVP